jgi:hypothetical protein
VEWRWNGKIFVFLISDFRGQKSNFLGQNYWKLPLSAFVIITETIQSILCALHEKWSKLGIFRRSELFWAPFFIVYAPFTCFSFCWESHPKIILKKTPLTGQIFGGKTHGKQV